MGLLDDAIREHLELKRLRGADPGDVAREEHAALGPVVREGDAESENSQTVDPDPARSDEPESPRLGVAPAGDSSAAGQETVEINMEAELAASDAEGDSVGASSERAEPVADLAHPQASTGDSLEWEMPGDADSGVEAEGTGEPVEDVLEETPDFLRDTPEQERLWFEQRPPRDFDFNE
jgi:hypothetical protein